ncbi:hypothetical protein CROQUDRAFT_665047 [Cronartium quercuum f. sp. fusiforme G11]|uniref:Phospholipid/glycerol acyltransferase domain-containing protein n=1 Tax=Cronartium quercuum f. sp. fusiforme G11 TaxID=708437 RepID=A0A9P6NA95_9BASI|nr:hypothetical protein CROQUDRAFT_665047 [Cronartium quercuum f. sp. fusiforme G11]
MSQHQSSIVSIPIQHRPNSSKSALQLLTFNISFFISLLILHSTQLIFFPLIFFKSAFDGFFWKINTLAKQVFAIVLVVITQVFGPSTFVITVDEGVDLSRMVRRDQNGRVLSLNLPKRSVMMANHQIYADWLYIWCLAYLGEIHGSIVIILKASLKWVPIVGPAMQLFSFIFLNRSWASDKASLTSDLMTMAHQALNSPDRQSLSLLIFPEGTLVSPHTRPISKRYCDQNGYPNLNHCLLPRSTGTLFCIRALSRSIPDLQLIDLTIGYPGIPAHGNGQDFYTLQSIFGYGHSPPKVHIHLRMIPISSIPIGVSPKVAGVNIDPTMEEAKIFDKWLRDQWIRKDEMLERFYQNGSMCELKEDELKQRKLEIKIGLRPDGDGTLLVALYFPGLLALGFVWICVIKPFLNLFISI